MSSFRVVDAEAAAVLAKRLRFQGVGCAAMGSSLYASLLERAAGDVEAGGPLFEVLTGHEGDPGPSALALRLLGAVHRLVLVGEAPELARHYPSSGGDGDAEAAWPVLRALVADRLAQLRPMIDRGVQTNEVGRSAALLGGFLDVAERWGLPLRCLEVGASAGLNLRWDQYRYEAARQGWGPTASPLRLVDPWVSGRPPLDVTATVVERRGCDLAPVDATTEEGRLTLLSFVWPDQRARFARLAAAIEVARALPVTVERADAVAWLTRRLGHASPHTTTVVFHSIVMQYLDDAGRAAVIDVLARAGARARPDAPLAHLRMEPGGDDYNVNEIRLTTWPGGEERVLGRAGGHGPPVAWDSGL